MSLAQPTLADSLPDRPDRSDGGRQGIQVVARAADILRTLKEDTSGPSLGAIARRVHLPRSTVQRIVNALVAEDLVSPVPASTGYMIGPEILALAQAGHRDVAKCLHPLMQDLSRKTGETVDLALYKNDQMVFVDQVSGTQRLRTVSAIGETFPMTVTANGKAALNWLDSLTIERIVEMERAQNICDHSLRTLFKELESIRQRGFALDADEHTEGISAVGMAFSVAGSIYALSIPAPSHRFKKGQTQFIDALLEVRGKIEQAVPGLSTEAPPSS